MLKIYGIAQSRAFRTYWMAEETGAPYEAVPVGFVDRKVVDPKVLALNPNARLPAIDDGGTVLFESLAINLYLARKYGGDLGPRDDAEAGAVYQWSFWAATEIEQPVLDWATHAVVLPPEQRDAKAAEAAAARMAKPLKVLDGALAGKQWLVGGRFTVADLNVAAVAYRLLWHPGLAATPNAKAWLDRCYDRPAAKKARKMREG